MNYKPTDSPTSKCSVCVLGQFCLPVGLSSSDVARVDALVKERVHLQKGESLYRHGDPLSSVYSVRFGTLKTEYCLQDGRQQVIGFHLPGEILGLDGIGEGHYQSDAIALEESEVCIIRYDAFEDLARQLPVLQNQFHKIMSRELTKTNATFSRSAPCVLKKDWRHFYSVSHNDWQHAVISIMNLICG